MGSAASGNFGHGGRPGERGGSGMTPALAESLHAELKKSGGFSHNLNTGEKPKDGYMVARSKSTETKYDPKTFGPEHIQQYAKDHASELARSGAHIGGWNDAKGRPTLDVSTKFDVIHHAMRVGGAAKQDAVYDVKAGKEIAIPKTVRPNMAVGKVRLK